MNQQTWDSIKGERGFVTCQNKDWTSKHEGLYLHKMPTFSAWIKMDQTGYLMEVVYLC